MQHMCGYLSDCVTRCAEEELCVQVASSPFSFLFTFQGAWHCCPPWCAVAGTSLSQLGLELKGNMFSFVL